MEQNTACPNCGVEISETPEEDGLHPVQMRQAVEGGEEYCEACAFRAPDHGTYEHDGDAIVRAAAVDEPDEELAELLAANMTAAELRGFMSGHGMTRSRGARKLESARQAVEQDRTRVAAWLDRVLGLAGGEHDCTVTCACGLEESFAARDEAVEAARAHKSDNPTHFPRARDESAEGDDARLYG
jgi:hypothetical protein